MAKIHINNPKQVINGGAKKYYFKVKGLGGPKGDKGDTGATGPQGPQGPQGNAATVSVGSTTTLPVGQDATVQNVGTLYNAVLNFGIPQGPRGPQGATGAKGDKGDKGEQGNPGPQGEKGTNATVTVGTTTTTEPGTQAYAWNSSSNPNNAVINFDIPRGSTGATGATGPQGPTGPTGPAGADGADGQDGQNFTPTIVETLPTTGDQSKLYLTPKAHTTSTATGNPIEATVTAQAGQLESFQLDGDTFQQSYTGKNLVGIDGITFPFTTNGVTVTREQDGSYTFNGTTTEITNFVLSPYSNQKTYNSLVAYNGQNVTLSLATSGTMQATQSTSAPAARNYGIKTWSGDDVFVATNDGTNFALSRSGTLNIGSYTDAYLGVRISNGVILQNFNMKIQLELGSTATAYEPFVGGQPSPSPEYPQQIQTVTGTQTISINGTNYPISLGSLELCGLVDDGAGGYLYNDGIYKNLGDGKWYVKKHTGKLKLQSSQGWSKSSITSLSRFFIRNYFPEGTLAVDRTKAVVISNYFIGISQDQSDQRNTGISQLGSRGIMINVTNGVYADATAFNAWLDSNDVVSYYALATPTDTAITDQTLIAQLEAIRTASLENGTNTITNTATGTNLAGDMEIGYFGFNPTNRYDKWLWLDINNEYEQIGGE